MRNSREDVSSSNLAARLSGSLSISLFHVSSLTTSDGKTNPGAMALTRMFGAKALAKIFVSDSKPALLTVKSKMVRADLSQWRYPSLLIQAHLLC